MLAPVDFAVGEFANGQRVSKDYVYVAKILLQYLPGFQQTLQMMSTNMQTQTHTQMHEWKK